MSRVSIVLLRVIRVQAIKRLFSGGPGQFEVGMDGRAQGGLGVTSL
jgi:hypothetical protein